MARLRVYKQIVQMRNEAPLTSGEPVWVKNSNPDGVVTFIRKKGNEEIWPEVLGALAGQRPALSKRRRKSS